MADFSDSKNLLPTTKCGFPKMYIAAIAALSFAMATGMVCGYSASATADMKRYSSPLRPNEDQVAWIGSIMALGAVLGGIVASFLGNRFGRKGTLMLNSIPFMLGWGFIAYADHFVYVYLGRFITGMCVGITCVTTPPYLIEISTPKVRGLLGASFQLFIVLGVLLVNALGLFLSWEWLCVPSAVLVVVAIIGMAFVPESPRWLIGKGGYQEAVSAINFLQGDSVDASAECVSIDEDMRLQPKGAISLKEIKKPEFIMPAFLSISLVFFQQTTGSNAVLFYTVEIFNSTQTSINPNEGTVVVDVVLVVATAISSVLMDKCGRKLLLMISGMGMAISLYIFGTYDYLSLSNESIKSSYGWVPLAALIVYISAFSIGFGPIPWLMMAEMTSVRSRSLICGAATALCWFFVFIITKTFQALTISIHNYGAYYLYASFAVLSCIFTYFCLPETKGISVEEIQQHFANLRKDDSKKDLETARELR